MAVITVQFTQAWSSRQAGDTQALPDDLAKALIDAGMAARVDVPVEKEAVAPIPEVIAAVAEPERNAMLPSPAKRKRGRPPMAQEETK